MCGIVGFVGGEEAAPILLDGLARLEYRGYDSAGVAVFDGEKLEVAKAKGRLRVHPGRGAYPVGHPRRAVGREFPPPGEPERADRRGAQRHH